MKNLAFVWFWLSYTIVPPPHATREPRHRVIASIFDFRTRQAGSWLCEVDLLADEATQAFRLRGLALLLQLRETVLRLRNELLGFLYKRARTDSDCMRFRFASCWAQCRRAGAKREHIRTYRSKNAERQRSPCRRRPQNSPNEPLRSCELPGRV
jgi:hypothetical protein